MDIPINSTNEMYRRKSPQKEKEEKKPWVTDGTFYLCDRKRDLKGERNERDLARWLYQEANRKVKRA